MAIEAFTLARRLRAGEIIFSGWCSLPYPIVAETVGREGFPAVTLEGQHGLWDVSSLLTGIAAVRQGGSAPIVRVPVGDFALVSRALDFGAEGIIAPDDQYGGRRAGFRRCGEISAGRRAKLGPHRATALAGLADQTVYLREANDHVVTLAMIETRTALENLEAILDTPGIDGLFLGPSDLSIALSGGKSLDPLSAEVEREIDRMVKAADAAGKIPGVFCHTAERAAALARRGVRFLAVSSDIGMLRAGAAAALKVVKG